MTVPRYDMELVSESDKLFAAGGHDVGTCSAIYYKKTTECYRPTLDSSWSLVVPNFLVREGGRLVATQGIMYFVGWDRHTTVAEYQALANSCSSAVQAMRIPRRNFAAAAADGIIYVVGGSIQTYATFQETKSLQSFDPRTGMTKDLADTLKPLGDGVRAVIIERMILPGLEPGLQIQQF